MFPKVITAEPLKPLILKLIFSNNEVRYFDVSPYCESNFFSELKDWDYFRSVRIINGVLSWPNRQDIAPETVYLEARENMN